MIDRRSVRLFARRARWALFLVLVITSLATRAVGAAPDAQNASSRPLPRNDLEAARPVGSDASSLEEHSFSFHSKVDVASPSGTRVLGGRFVLSRRCPAAARLGSGSCSCLCGNDPPIFADGFESGDTSAWSEAVP